MVKIINKYYEPELKQVRVVLLEEELNKLEQENERLNNSIKEEMTNSDAYQQIFDYFGYENQRRKLIEETQEVNDAILLYEKGEGDIKDVIEEIGDLLNIINGFITAYDIKFSEISDSMANKLSRTIYRINSGYYKKGK